MGTFTSQSYVTSEGREFVVYLDGLISESARMMKAGRIPETDGVHEFLDFAKGVVQQLRLDVNAAAAARQTTMTCELTMSKDEYKRMTSMGESIRNLMEILELRQAVSLNRTEGVGRVSEALFGGQYRD